MVPPQGQVDAINLLGVAIHGTLAQISRIIIFIYTKHKSELLQCTDNLFCPLQYGKIQTDIGKTKEIR